MDPVDKLSKNENVSKKVEKTKQATWKTIQSERVTNNFKCPITNKKKKYWKSET